MDLQYMQSRFSLDGRKAVVTGSSGGIGRGIALSLARFGAKVAVLGRNEEKLKETVRLIRDAGGEAASYAFDVADPEANEAFFDAYTAENGAPDIFVCNAGMSVFKHLLDTENAEMDRLIDTDLKGAVYGLRRAGQLMKENGGGNIVIVTSVNAFYPLPSQAVYTGIKCALEGIMRSMAADLGKYGVRVNSLAPGAVNTDLGSPHSEEKHRPMHVPLGVVGEPEDMGDVVSCMVSDAFSYMTGSTVLVDGGLMLRPEGR